MMRRLCTGQHRALQDILRVQKLNRETVDLLNDVYRYMTALEPGLKKAIEAGDESIVEGAIRGWLMLADAMQGPNFDNQSSLSKTGIFDLADRIYSKIRYTAERGGPARKAVVKFKNSSIHPEERSFEVLDQVDDQRCRLKTAVTTCLSSFLEGVQDDAIPQQMIMTAQWTNIMSQMVQCYEMAIGFELLSVGTLKKDSVIQEGLGYYALMRNVSSFDDNNSIDRVLSTHKRAEAYFKARTGYVEISRNDKLERLFFRLPDNCVVGGPLDKPFSEMYETEREDADKKNKEYLEHMVRLVDRERFHAGIRESFLAFTVNQWDRLCSLTFWWGVFLHCVLILGGYMIPDQENEAAALVEFGGDDGDHDVGIGFTFMFGVLPYTNLCAQYMCYIYLGLCVLRALSFFWAESPLIAMESVSAAEEGEEDDDDGKESASQEEEDDGEDDDEALLIRGYVVSKDAPSVLDQDDDDEDIAKKAQGAVARARTTVWALATSPKVVYEVLFLLSGILSVVLDQPLFSVFSLFELCFWSGSKTVIDAIRFNLGKMMQTMLLGLLTMYVWMILGMVLLRKQHNDEMCNNMFQCFMAYLYLSIRDNGVKEVLREFDPPRNIVEAFIGQDLFILAIFWDITYWLLFILILVAIITGIVIDAFGGMREAKEADESDLKANCFVCNLARFPLDQTVGFDHHVRAEHNPRWYLFFLMYLRGKAETQMTGQERYVFDRVWPSLDYRWLPRETTFSVREEDSQEDVIQTVHSQVNNVESKVEQLASAIARIEDHLEKARQ